MAERFPVIFLDFDGVLNSEAYLKLRGRALDPERVTILNQLVERSGAKVVVTSMWRLGGLDFVRDHLKRVGCVAEVIGITTVIDHDRRGNEIQEWLSEHSEQVSSFVILDDSNDMAHLLPRLVRTTWEHGMQPFHVTRCLAKLAEPWSSPVIWLPREVPADA